MLTFLSAASPVTSFVKRVQAVSKIVPDFCVGFGWAAISVDRLYRIALQLAVDGIAQNDFQIGV